MALLNLIERLFPSRSTVFSGCVVCGALMLAVRAQSAPLGEYQVKAVFLFNFAQFVEWPPQTFAAADTPFVIGVLGEDPFGSSLDETVRDEKLHEHPFVVRRYRHPEEITRCHILFISRSEDDRVDRIFAELRGRNILTVGESEAFAQRGGMIRFVVENNKIRFRIDLDAARAADLTISSKLLRPAGIVAPAKS